MARPNRPRLIALDEDDLAVISAHVQNASLEVGDIVWRQDLKRLVIGMTRHDWEQSLQGVEEPSPLLSALRFDRVLACKSRDIDLEAARTLTLLGIEFHSDDPPGGSAVLIFAEGGALRLDLECLECELADLGVDDLGDADTADSLG